jgi:hypothetical protein
MGWRTGVSPEIRQEPTAATLVRARILIGPVRAHGVEWLEGGEVVLDLDIDGAEALAAEGKIEIEARPRLRSKRPNLLIGRRVCGVGEESCATTLELAKMYVAEGAAEWVNRREVPHDWKPPRASDRDLLPLVALADLLGATPISPIRPEGSRFLEGREPALELVRNGLAEPVGWRVPAPSPPAKKRP